MAYTIGHIDVLGLVEKYDAPLFVYDAEHIKRQYDRFVSSFKVPSLKVHYACKALSNINILRLFNEWGAGIDCVSINEVRLALKAGFSETDILFTPNNISTDEMEQAIAKGVKINVDNLSMLEYIGLRHPKLPICIRINPHLMAGGHNKISVGHINSKFGISIHQVPLIKRIVKRYQIKVEGIHLHTGSDILDPDTFLMAADVIFEVVRQIPGVDFIDFGSGFKVKYRPSDLETDIEAFGAVFSKKFNQFVQEIKRPLTLRFEPGKYLVSEAGYFLARANVIKQTTACTFVGLDTGFNHLVRPMFYGSYHEIYNISNLKSVTKKLYTVSGYICETDTFAVDRILPEVRQGDILMFCNAGAYGFEMSSNYNSRLRPAEVILRDGRAYLARKRECFEALLANQVLIDW